MDAATAAVRSAPAAGVDVAPATVMDITGIAAGRVVIAALIAIIFDWQTTFQWSVCRLLRAAPL
jgi:hypothetical protein